MKGYHMIAITFALALTGLLLAPSARADDWNQTTRVTATEPVRVPGMVLAPGTYTFKFDPLTKIVQIWNGDQTRLYENILTIPEDRTQPTGHTVLELNEGSKGTPPELQAWFYPGETSGHEFVYSRLPRAAEKPKA